MPLLKCSFCDKTEKLVQKLIAGPGIYICDECIVLCSKILKEELPDKMDSTKVASAVKLKKILDRHVVGQEKAKKALAVAVRNHYKRIDAKPDDSEVEIQKSNILLIGPTGTGKTLLVQTLAKALNVPFVITDATPLTQAGYVGEDVENILFKLVQAAGGDIKKAEEGIVYIDEIDKISRRASSGSSNTKDVSGEGVQQALLKIVEGTIASVPSQGGRKNADKDLLQIDTNNILFICGGSFNGLEGIIQDRFGKKGIGFSAEIQAQEENVKKFIKHVLPEDLIKFGLIPELVGRLPIVTILEVLTKKDLIAILTEPKNAIIKQYKKMFQMDNIVLEFLEEAIDAIAEIVITKKTGARGLRAIVENILMDTMYEMSEDWDVEKCIVTKETIIGKKGPILIRAEKFKRAHG